MMLYQPWRIAHLGRILTGLTFVVCGVISHSTPAAADAPDEVLTTVRHLAIQHNGRLKPVDSFAREVLALITGSSRWQGQDPVATLLPIIADPEPWQATAMLSVPFHPLREALGLDPSTTHISYDELIATRRLMRLLPPIVQKQQRDEKLTMLENETMDAYNRFVTLSALFEHRLALLPPVVPGERTWHMMQDPAGYAPERQAEIRGVWNAFIGSLREGDEGAIVDASRQLDETLRTLNPPAYPASWRLRLEVLYNRVAPFRVARVWYLASFIAFLIGVAWGRRSGFTVGMATLGVGFAIHAAGILLRVVLGGRPPVSNFYETMLWIPLIAVLLALVFERIYRSGYFGLSSSLLAAIVLVLADHLPLDASISPVVAVLRSNLWLTIHVLTIVASYGALALAVVLAHVHAMLYLTRQGAHPALLELDTFLYRSLQVGVVLLAVGIILGGVWANASWGRYWGWDPKETWALITLLWYLALLHGRFAGWIRGVGTSLATIGGFFLLLMTYYGVSFYLVGLHSYAGGNAKPLPPLLIGYLIAEVAFLAVVGVTAMSRRRLT